jgi:hypothetical protein
VRSRLVLGTAQFGLGYGISNRAGQVERTEAAKVLGFAKANGMDMIDTAIAYGESEGRLGEIGVPGWKIITKLPPVPDSCADVRGWVRKSVLGSLRRLGVSRLYGMLLHRSQELLVPGREAINQELLTLKEEGLIERIGISIYDPEELDAIGSSCSMEIVQAPYSILDRRLAKSGWLERLHDAGIEVHVRSVFLQGLLLMRSGERPAIFGRWNSLWDMWDAWLRDMDLGPLQACLSFVLNHPYVDRVVVGVESRAQLSEIIKCQGMPVIEPPADLASDDPKLINPSRWCAA